MLQVVRAVSFTGYHEVARFHGLNPNELLFEFGITPELLSNPENRIPAKAATAAIKESARRSDCDTFGLEMAKCRTFASLGPVSLLLQQLATMHDVIEALKHYRRHLNDITIFSAEPSEDAEVVRVELAPGYADAQLADLAVGVSYIGLAGASRCRWRPERIHFTHPAPRDESPYRELFGAPLEFGSTFNGFTSSRRAMREPWPWANETMARNARHLLDMVQLPPEIAPVSGSVSRMITLLMPSGRATLQNVAKLLGRSPRALQRSLEVEGRGFSDLLNEARRSLALQYLCNDGSSITSIAGMLGYFTSSSMNRWFIGEFGVPPTIWRAERARAAQHQVL